MRLFYFRSCPLTIYQMRVLQISSAKNFGGGERHLVDLCRSLYSNGNVVFAVVRTKNDWDERLSFLAEKNLLRLPLRNSLDVFSAVKLAEFIRHNKIDIVHVHLARDYPVAGLAVRLCKNAKLVLTRHVLFPLNGLQKFALSNVSKAVAVSKAVEVLLQKTFPAEKITVVSNGIDTEKWNRINRQELNEAFRNAHEIPLDARLIGTVGELKELKGQQDFVLAAQIVAGKFPDARFVIVGKDNSRNRHFRQKLKRMVKIFGLEQRFLWLDWVEDIEKLISALDIFVSASHTESFGLAIIEAMAGGCAVAATKTAGAAEIIKHNETGLLVSLESPVKLAEAVGSLLADDNLRRRLSENAQKTVSEKFDISLMTAETEKIYREIIGDGF